jgi:hypothetical protein
LNPFFFLLQITLYPSSPMSSALSRRLANRRAEATQKLIVFWIGQVQFALPIQAAERVVKLEQLYGAPSGNGLQFTHYQNQEILVIDAERRIFGDRHPNKGRSLLPAARSASDVLAPGQPAAKSLFLVPSPPATYLLILQDAHGEAIGISLNAPPSLRRVPISAFKPLPSAYLADGSIRCISALIAAPSATSSRGFGQELPPEVSPEVPPEPPLFLLNLDLLLQPPSC